MSSFSVSKAIGRFFLPNFERDLSKAVGESLHSSASLTDCFLAPAVYGFEKRAGYGIGHATSAVERRAFEKVHYPIPPKGLFR